MKKVFTLIAAALMAVGVMAQQTITLYHPTSDKLNVLEGELLGQGVADGWKMQCLNTTKNLEQASDITVNGTKYRSIKLSNGAQSQIWCPEGIVMTKVTVYSYVNIEAPNRTPYWAEVNGVTYSAETATIMQSYKDGANPDVVSFDLGGVSTFTIRNEGEQPCAVFVIEYDDSQSEEYKGYKGGFTYTLNGSEVSDPVGFFSHGDTFSFNAKYAAATYNGIAFTKGLKMESGTSISFSTTETSTVTIVQCSTTFKDNTYTPNTFTIKFDGNELAITDATEGTGCRVYTLNNVAAGEHTITRGSGESGLFYVKVVYTTKTINVTDALYRTFAFDAALDFSDVEGLTAYTATVSDDDVNFDEVKGTVPAGIGLLLKAKQGGDYTIPVAVDEIDDVESALKGVLTDGETTGPGAFVLHNKGEQGLGFYRTKASEFKLTKNTAYLPAEVSGVHYIAVPGKGGDGTTSLNSIKNVDTENGKLYDLQGRQVSNPTKGLYISNGKKYIVK